MAEVISKKRGEDGCWYFYVHYLNCELNTDDVFFFACLNFDRETIVVVYK